MNGFEAIYGHLGASKLLNARKPPSPAPTTTNGLWWKQSEAKLPKHQHKALEQVDEDGEDEFEDEVIEEMSGNWPPSSSAGVQAVVPRVDSVEWTKMEEGPDEENVVSAGGDNDDSSPQRAAQKALKRKRKPSPELKADAGGADQPAGKKRLSCIDCGCRAALKACSKVMCIDCCAKDSRVCDAHAKKLYDQATEKEASSSGGSNKVKASAGTKPSKKKPKRDGSGPEDDGDGGDDDSGEGSPERDADREVAAMAGEEAGGGKAKRSALYETIAKQDRKIRALQNDLKELRTLLLSVVDKQSTFSRQLRHLSGAQSDGLVIDEDDEGDEDDDDSR